MKNITNKKLNQLTILAATLPKLQKKNTDGTKMFHKATKVINGKDLTKKQVKDLGEEYFPEKNYVLTYMEPTLIDHRQNLIEAFQKKGDIGVEKYIKELNEFYKTIKPIEQIKSKLNFLSKLKSHFKKWLSNFKLN